MYPNIDEVKKILRSLLVATPRGLSVRDLDKVFREIEGRQIPFREFAFDTLTRFLYSMPETLRVSIRIGKKESNYSGYCAYYNAFFVIRFNDGLTEHTAYIHEHLIV